MEWKVFCPEEENRKRFPGLPWEHEANWTQLTDEYPPNSIGARQVKRMQKLVNDKAIEVNITDQAVIEEALRLSRQVMEGVDSVEDLLSVAQTRINISSKSF